MATDANLRGVYIPIITPFDEDGSVAIDALERLCREYLDAGAAGIVALGTTGESTALDTDEKHAVIDACSNVCAERSAQLIVGAGTNNTRTTRQAVKELAGTSALLVRRHDGLNWAVLFNTRNSEGEPLAKVIDPLLHKAANQVQRWPEADQFQSFGPPTPNGSK